MYESTHYVQQAGQFHIFHPCTQFSNMNKPGFWFKLNEYMIYEYMIGASGKTAVATLALQFTSFIYVTS